jgi:hypothetical protein
VLIKEVVDSVDGGTYLLCRFFERASLKKRRATYITGYLSHVGNGTKILLL